MKTSNKSLKLIKEFSEAYGGSEMKKASQE